VKLQDLLIRARGILHGEGWKGFVLKILRKIHYKVFITNHAYWFVRDLREKIERPSPKVPVKIDFSNKEDTIRWLQENHSRFGWMYIPDEISLAHSCGHYLPSIRLDGKVVGYIKIGRERAYVLDYERELHLPSRDALVYDTFVLPEYRRKRIASFLIAEAMAFLREEGFRRLWCHIPPWNTSSIRAFCRSGFRRIAHIRFFKVLGRSFFSLDPERLIGRVASR